MKLVTAEQMRAIEARAAEIGLTSPVLMEQAGRRVAEATVMAAGGIANRHVLVLVGPGNNGGDGLVAARYLHDWGARVQLYLWNRRTEDDANFAETQRRQIPALQAVDDPDAKMLSALLAERPVVIDALLGTGKARPIAGSLRDLLQRLADSQTWQARPLVIAVDLPTGLNADTGEVDPVCVRADVTVTLGYPKVGLIMPPGAEYVGRLMVGEIGIPDHLAADVRRQLVTDADIARLLPARPRWSHKGTFGKVLVVAGSRQYVGAAALATIAAGRIGAGLVTLACPNLIYPALTARLTESTFLPLEDDGEGAIGPVAVSPIVRAIGEYDATLIGPGLGRHPLTANFLHRLLDQLAADQQSERSTKPLVLDADALNLLARIPNWWQRLGDRVVLTPHLGEMSRLSGLSIAEIQVRRLDLIIELAARWQKTILLKGPPTIIATPAGDAMVIPIATPALATAGSGDVLAGVLVGLLAQGLSPDAAATAAAAIHGRAGQALEQTSGQAGALAGDLLPILPQIVRRLRRTPPPGPLVWVA